MRLHDNEALAKAIEIARINDAKVLCMYSFEPILLEDQHYSQRHWDFVSQGLQDMKRELGLLHTDVMTLEEDVLHILQTLLQRTEVVAVVSHIETGLMVTYKRDIAFAKACKNKGITWYETQNNGVFRFRTDRKTWRRDWKRVMEAPQVGFDGQTTDFVSGNDIAQLSEDLKEYNIDLPRKTMFQPGGREAAMKYFASFMKDRIRYYSRDISKPEESRVSLSRLSPYFAWGNLSIREVYQAVAKIKALPTDQRLVNGERIAKPINAFASRLRWQSHFIQKFEQEPRIQFEPFNRGYLQLDWTINDELVQAWEQGQTGYPLVDASMRCVVKTGYLNFRMRAMVVSFLCHQLLQPFWAGSAFLARQFLDFEPGIHYGQFNMQAGVTGINTVRIYNPVLNSLKHDTDALFLKKWLPELRHLPVKFIHEPWKLTQIEQDLYDFQYGEDYPTRIVDHAEARKAALAKLYGARKSELTKRESERILAMHTLPGKRFA